MKKYFYIFCFLFISNFSFAQQKKNVIDEIRSLVNNPPQSAKPWVFWYWVNGCVSKEGVTADLEAMKRVGLGGAYLMFIRDTTARINFQPQIRQLSPQWYAMVSHAISEAKRLNLKLGLHYSDGFALAGGPWITPEQSMQKLVWTKTVLTKQNNIIPQPETNIGFYKDIKTFAYKINYQPSNAELITVTSNTGANLFYLTQKDSTKTFRSDTNCYINFNYNQDFTLRQILIKKQNNAYQAQRFILQASKDGVTYITIDTLTPPRHGWQDNSVGYTHALKNYTSKYFRLVWKKEGIEPGSEDLDAAKWKPVLRVQGIYLSEEPTINNIEAKNGMVWRKAKFTTSDALPKATIVKEKDIIDVTKYLYGNELRWKPPNNSTYVIVRIGHTTTGQTNETAGGGKGLECDKLNAKAVTNQYNNWFKNIFTKTNAKGIVNTLHIDSWECGSQNWTNDFDFQFKKINNYDLNKNLLIATGVPVTSVQHSEKVLKDFRNTIATSMQERFFGTIHVLAKKDKLQISAESTAPTFVGDALAHYKYVDIPMGEFWLNSPTHDKPNDMADAINAAHIYGKNIVGAEAFTTLRMDWSETPGSLKQLGDWAFTQGVNKLAIHVMVHNPWMDRKPGMTLDGIGLYYQRDQPWFEQSKAWIDYLTRTQALLQLGKPTADFAVYIGDDKPVRSFLPHQLVNDFPSLFTKSFIEKEKQRLANIGQPLATLPEGVTHTANTLKAPLMLNAIGNYKYDCINTEILKQLKVKNGKIIGTNGNEYHALLIPKIAIGTTLNKDLNEKIKQIKNSKGLVLEKGTESKIDLSNTLQVDNENIAFIKRIILNAELYYFSNVSDINIESNIKIKSNYKKLYQYDIYKNKFYFNKNFEKLQIDKRFEITNSQPLVLIAINDDIEEVTNFLPPPLFKTVTLGNWDIKFHSINKTEKYDTANLSSWTNSANNAIKFYSGTAIYSTSFETSKAMMVHYPYLKFDSLHNIATVKINGIFVETIWKQPYDVFIKDFLKPGTNTIEIEVANTWHNALIGQELYPDLFPNIYTNAPFRLKNKVLLPAGIIGSVKIVY